MTSALKFRLDTEEKSAEKITLPKCCQKVAKYFLRQMAYFWKLIIIQRVKYVYYCYSNLFDPLVRFFLYSWLWFPIHCNLMGDLSRSSNL